MKCSYRDTDAHGLKTEHRFLSCAGIREIEHQMQRFLFFQQIQEGQQISLILNLLSSLNLLEIKFPVALDPSAASIILLC
jgi:hypothetical protein